MNCRTCGSVVDPADSFCKSCGLILRLAPPPPVQNAALPRVRPSRSVLGVALVLVLAILLLAVIAWPRAPTQNSNPPQREYSVTADIRGSCSQGFSWSGKHLTACFSKSEFGMTGVDRMVLIAGQGTPHDAEVTCYGWDDIAVGVPYCSASLSLGTSVSCYQPVHVEVIVYQGPNPSPVRELDAYC